MFSIHNDVDVVAHEARGERERRRRKNGAILLVHLRGVDLRGGVSLVLNSVVVDDSILPDHDLRDVVSERVHAARPGMVSFNYPRLTIIPEHKQVAALDDDLLISVDGVEDANRPFDNYAVRNVQEHAVQVEGGVQCDEGVFADLGVAAEVPFEQLRVRCLGLAEARDHDLAQPVQLRKRRLENAVHDDNRAAVKARDVVRGHVVQCDAECTRIEKRHVAWKRLTDVGVLPFLVSLGRNAKCLERIAAAPT